MSRRRARPPALLAHWVGALVACAAGCLPSAPSQFDAGKARAGEADAAASAHPADAAPGGAMDVTSGSPRGGEGGTRLGKQGRDAGHSPARGPQACPADMVLVHGWFCPSLRYVCLRYVDEAEYRCAEYARERPCLGQPDLRRFCIDRYEWPNRVGESPRVYVSWFEAKQACAAVGKRLCRRSEWVLACEGPKRLPYPWGYVRRPSPCNIDRSPIPFDVGALQDDETRAGELARLWQADPIGSHPDCVSSFGVADMAGNVDEWTDNLADDPTTGRPSTLNGGYWGPVRDTCRLTTKKHGPKFRFYQVGFRCCRDPLDSVPRTAAGEIGPPRPWVDPEPRPPSDSSAEAPAEAPERGRD